MPQNHVVDTKKEPSRIEDDFKELGTTKEEIMRYVKDLEKRVQTLEQA